MGRYLVELYAQKSAAREIASATARARAAAGGAGRNTGPVRCLRSIFVPEDETWFLLYEGPTIDAVRDAVERAGLTCARVVAAVAPQ
jgi:hypothetical protein